MEKNVEDVSFSFYALAALNCCLLVLHRIDILNRRSLELSFLIKVVEESAEKSS